MNRFLLILCLTLTNLAYSADDDFKAKAKKDMEIMNMFKTSATNIINICDESFRIINSTEITQSNMETKNSKFEKNYEACVSSLTDICVKTISLGIKAARWVCEEDYLPLVRQKFDEQYEIFYLRSQNLLKDKEIAELKDNKKPKLIEKCKYVNKYGHDHEGDSAVILTKECKMEEVLTREERLERAKDRPGYKIGTAIRNLFTKD